MSSLRILQPANEGSPAYGAAQKTMSAQNPSTQDFPSHMSLCWHETVHKQASWRGPPRRQQ